MHELILNNERRFLNWLDINVSLLSKIISLEGLNNVIFSC